MKRISMIAIFLFVFIQSMAVKASDGAVEIYYQDNAQFELVGDNQRILIDVYDPSRLTTPPSTEDILLTTHPHWDHLNPAFFYSFPGRRFNKPGRIKQGGFMIHGVMTSHYSIPEDPIPKAHRNIAYIIDYKGLRIVHFGDNQQLILTKEQLQKVGRVDIAIVSLTHDPMGYIDPAGFGFLAQIKPKLIIPAHMNENAGRHALHLWKGYRTDDSFINIGADDLKGETKLLLMGKNARLFSNWPTWPPSN